MVLCNVDCVRKVAGYLDVSLSQLHDKNVKFQQPNDKVRKFCSIIQTLIRTSKYSDALGTENSEMRALSQQWLEYIVICVNGADSRVNATRVLNELNTVLRDVTYLIGTKKTIADVILYYALYSIMKELSPQEKAQYVHLSRWFDNIQQEEKLRGKLDLISFNLLHLFL